MKDNFSYNSSTYNYDELNITLLDYKPALNSSFKNIGYFGEIRDDLNSTAYGFLYKDTDFSNTYTIGQPTTGEVNSYIDSVHSSSSFSSSLTSGSIPNEISLSFQEAFIVSFTQVDNYANGYSSSELVYELDFDDGNNWLELIKDNDRDNEIVGFRYYSNLNSSTYTKFIKPNN